MDIKYLCKCTHPHSGAVHYEWLTDEWIANWTFFFTIEKVTEVGDGETT
ncbi:hypothetical protein ACFSR7_36105 [Cohnella sp. GCM10020058]